MPQPPSISHDSGYKLLFAHPRMVADPLRGFVKPAWLHLLDLDTLEPHKASFATDDLRQRHDDCIWRVKMRDHDTWLYLYILIEFQSQNEHFMAVRILSYEALLYQDLVHTLELKPGDRLPPIIPVVIYNGSAPWTGPLEVAELINLVHPALSDYTPRLRYFLLQERSVAREFSIQHPKNLVGHLIAIGQSRSPEEMNACIERLNEHTDTPQDVEIRRTFAIWLSHLLRRRFRNNAIPEFQNLQEVHTMLAQNLEEWVQSVEDRGIAKGETKGIAKGEAILLQRQLTRKFGTLPETLQQRIQTATPAQLETWSLNILDATTLDDVFA